MSTPVVVALGANLGDAARTLDEAVTALRAVEGLQVEAVSQQVVTAPVGGPAQPDYRNAVLLARTTLSPTLLLAVAHSVEARHGRERGVRWGPRTLDVDLVAYGEPGAPDEVVQVDAVLTLPHPRAHERAFVLAPWASVDPRARLRLPDGRVVAVLDQLALTADRSDVLAEGAAS